MATLNKIRSKAGLLVVIIGVALLAFIVGDFLNSGHTFYAMNQNKVAVVNGTNIGVEEFLALSDSKSLIYIQVRHVYLL